jgi:hypothetical protein
MLFLVDLTVVINLLKSQLPIMPGDNTTVLKWDYWSASIFIEKLVNIHQNRISTNENLSNNLTVDPSFSIQNQLQGYE